VLLLLLALRPLPGMAQSLFASHEVTVEFANAAGKPLADAEVRVFAPGRPDHPALTGHTDSKGHFRFPADRDGFWTAEAKEGGEIAHVMIRVGSGKGEAAEPLSPYWLIGGLVLLLVLAFGYRLARIRSRRPPRG
jgi:hypothetical protein